MQLHTAMESEPKVRHTVVSTHWNCFGRCGHEEMVATNPVWAIGYLEERGVGNKATHSPHAMV